MKIFIEKSKVEGIIEAPPSKSETHRALISASLANGISKISNISYSMDVKATIECLMALGIKILCNKESVEVYGNNGKFSQENTTLNCNESGSTLRFLIPLCVIDNIERKLCGSSKLMSRPVLLYKNIFEKSNVKITKLENELLIKGKLKSGEYQVDGNVSSQFISGLLFALPLLKGDSKIKINKSIESKSYINLTKKILKLYNINIFWENENTLFIKGNQQYKSTNVEIEGDYSNAAFLDAFNLIGGKITIKGLNDNTIQGDKIYKKYFDIIQNNKKEKIDLSDCPDLAPVLFTLSAIKGNGYFINTNRLKLKESDRGKAMQMELKKCGIDTKILDNEIIIKGKLEKPKTILNGHNDHRIVMALSVLLSLTGGSIDGMEAINKSFPDFFYKLQNLGLKVKYDS
ncbi:MAG: 3-phosphoshikimate 1-carboxyvinyltransferase [Eubacteriales bacterium]|nr:3-phosphoshikimate 1-carboxyvinyltransferase [Eubacteriales bacterium]